MLDSSEPIIHAQGDSGRVTLDREWLTIEREGWSRLGHSEPDKQIRVDEITRIRMRPARILGCGFIAFETVEHEFSGGRGDANYDDNAVVFRREQSGAFSALRAALKGLTVAR